MLCPETYEVVEECPQTVLNLTANNLYLESQQIRLDLLVPGREWWSPVACLTRLGRAIHLGTSSKRSAAAMA